MLIESDYAVAQRNSYPCKRDRAAHTPETERHEGRAAVAARHWTSADGRSAVTRRYAGQVGQQPRADPVGPNTQMCTIPDDGHLKEATLDGERKGGGREGGREAWLEAWSILWEPIQPACKSMWFNELHLPG